MGVLSLGSKQYKLAHGNRGFKKTGENGGEGGRFEPWLETIQISPRRPWVQKTGENGGEGGRFEPWCKRTHGLISCYRWFDYFWTLCVGVETPTYKLYINQLEISESKMLFKHLKKSPRQQILRE